MTIDSGLLWFASPLTSIKIEGAMKYFEMRYGRQPKYLHVNPHQFEDLQGNVLSIPITANLGVLTDHVWIG